MTGHQINSLVGDLVAMAQAMEELPKVRHELHLAQAESADLLNRIESVKADLTQSQSYAATLEQKVRDAEVAKDQAETMFLEADERTSRALDFIKATFGNAGSLIQALESVKEVPVPLEHTLSSGHMEAGSSGQSMAGSTALNEISHFEAGIQGQSEPDPTPSSHTQTAPISDVTTGDASPLANASGPAESWAGPASTDTPLPAGPYLNRRYIDVPGWISRQDWVNGGGTDADYDWRG